MMTLLFFLVWLYTSGALVTWLFWNQSGNQYAAAFNPITTFIVVAVFWFITIPVAYISAMAKNKDG